MSNPTSTKRQYPLPSIQNPGATEVERLRTTVQALDSDIDTLILTTDHLQINKADLSTVEAQQLQISNLSVLVFANL